MRLSSHLIPQINYNQCLDVIDDYSTNSFSFNELPDSDNLELFLKIDGLTFKVSEFYDTSDILLFFDLIINSIKKKQFEILNDALKMIDELHKTSQEPLKSIIRNQFHTVFLAIIQVEEETRINYHIVLQTVLLAENILEEQHNTNLSRDDISVYKVLYLIKTFKRSSEIFLCGCIQHFIIKMHREDNGKLFSKNLNSIQTFISNQGICKSNRSVITKYSYLFPIKYSLPDCFEFYVEMLRELINCRVIERTNEDILKLRLPFIIRSLEKLSSNDFSTGCRHVIKLLNAIHDQTLPIQNISNVLAISYKQFLLPSIFRFVQNFDHQNKEIFENEKVEYWVRKIENTGFTQQNDIFFLPALLLKSLIKTQDVDVLIKNYLEDYMKTLEVYSSNIQSIIVYLIFIFLHLKDSTSLFRQFLGLLVFNYKENQRKKIRDTVIFSLDLLNGISKNNEIFAAILKKENVQSKLLLESKLSPEEFIYHVTKFEKMELQCYLEQNIKNSESLNTEQWLLLLNQFEKMNFYINYNIIWDHCLQNNQENSKFIKFLVNQLMKIDTKIEMKKRVEQIMGFLKAEGKPTLKIPAKNLALEFLDVVLTMESSHFLPSFTDELIPLGVVVYCCYFEGEDERRILIILNKLIRRIEENLKKLNVKLSNSLDYETDDPIEIFLRICEISKSALNGPGCCDLKIWMKLKTLTSNGETFIKVLKGIVEFDSMKTNWKTIESYENAKTRIMLVFSKIYKSLIIELRKMGDKGVSPFCMIATTIEKHLVANLKKSIRNEVFLKVAVEMCEAYSYCEKDWNVLFVSARVMTILISIKEEKEELENLGSILERNEILKERLVKLPDYKKISHFLNW